MCFSLRLLRVLDALTIRFYNFPSEVAELVHLRYVGGKLPSSISKLWNLQYLIVRRYQIIKSSGSLSYLPREIWNMQELRHLQVMGSILPDPRGAVLPNLVKILDVSAHSCTKEVFEAVLNLEKLGIQMEYALDGDHKFCCFDHLSHLRALKSLKCVAMVIRNLKSRVVAPPASTKNFPLGLEKLTLSGLGYSWQHMSKIAASPNLKVLKLRNYAFRGSEWTTDQGDFRQVKILVLEDTDLRHWRAKLRPFKALEHLIVRHCYKLEKIPSEIGDKLRGLKMMELVDVKPSLVASAKKMQHRQTLVMASANECFQLRTRSSWEDMELKS
ncbi:hypothetical protein BUALT_Bualt02G0144600 [Buddleja alternifolia]|uniref:Uncharacterized protein n=1 Tax=Buddleja alternifolia TaxID=168488 RepID=A0AAV6Y8T7_9LAMI|nr:hypothetical protein BUALT_Bualt02G0144600 [Buddleja alternifolia]